MEELKAFRSIKCKYAKAPEIFCAKYSHISSADFKQVYEPNEDTFLLVDALYCDLQSMVDSRPATCVEIGPGSGVVSD